MVNYIDVVTIVKLTPELLASIDEALGDSFTRSARRGAQGVNLNGFASLADYPTKADTKAAVLTLCAAKSVFLDEDDVRVTRYEAA